MVKHFDLRLLLYRKCENLLLRNRCVRFQDGRAFSRRQAWRMGIPFGDWIDQDFSHGLPPAFKYGGVIQPPIREA